MPVTWVILCVLKNLLQNLKTVCYTYRINMCGLFHASIKCRIRYPLECLWQDSPSTICIIIASDSDSELVTRLSSAMFFSLMNFHLKISPFHSNQDTNAGNDANNKSIGFWNYIVPTCPHPCLANGCLTKTKKIL